MRLKTDSYWISSTRPSPLPKLQGDISVDVAVVGAGITGITAALLLKEAGKTVALIDHSRVATGESGHTTAHITEQAVDARYHSIAKDFGRAASKLVAQSSRAAIEQIAAWVDRFNIPCDFLRVPGFLYAQNSKDVSELRQELSSAKSAGIDVKWTSEVPLPFRPNPKAPHKLQGGIHFENQAQFHPRKYLLGLANRVPGKGCFVFENTKAVEIEDGDLCKVTTDQGVITCKEVIVATHTPISNRVVLHTKIAAYRTYVLAIETNQNPTAAALYWDNEDPYHYIRSHHGLWIIGGEDHKTGMKQNTLESFQNLEDFTELKFGLHSTAYSWSGQVHESVDGLPFIGKNPLSQHLYVATGFGGNGMTFGTISGIILSDIITHKENHWLGLYNPSRIKPLASAATYLSENKDFSICFLKDRIGASEPSDPSRIAEIAKGEGKILKKDGKRLAVSRDEKGAVHSVSAVCPHLGCIVHWNNSERSWDCPCHGSRFSAEGTVLNGPRNARLG